MSGPRTLYLYLSTQGVQGVFGQGKTLLSGPFFAHPQAGATPPPEALAWLSTYRYANCCVLVDVAEESFGDDSIPVMGMRDMRLFMQRRLAQRFRDAPLSHWTPPPRGWRRATLGTQYAPRRLPVTWSVINQSEVVAHWLALIAQHELALHTVISPGLLALRWVQKHQQSAHALVVSWTPAGLRLTVIHNRVIVFSRLTPMTEPVDRETLRQECARTVSYLITAKHIQRADCESGALPIMVLEGGIADWHSLPDALTLEAGLTLAMLRVPAHPSDQTLFPGLGAIPSWCRAVQLRAVHGSPAGGYASRAMTQLGRLRHLERRLRWSGLLGIGVALSLLGGLVAWERVHPMATPAMHHEQTALADEQQGLQSALQDYPVHGTELQQIVTLGARVQGRHVPPAPLMSAVAHGLTAAQGLTLQTLRWRRLETGERAQWTTLELDPTALDSASGRKQTTPQFNPNEPSAPPTTHNNGPEAVVLELHGSVSDTLSLSAANAQVQSLERALAQHCACTSQVTVWPYDPTVSSGFSREWGGQARTQAPQAPAFTLRLLLGAAPAND